MMPVQITKADGSVEPFKVEKLRRSLRRAGAEPKEITSIVNQISVEIYDGMRTQEIYRRAFDLLRAGKEDVVAARYSLRRALFSLGPTGFPFESFLGRLFAAHGYSTRTGITIQGKCAAHEIDIAAFNEKHSFVGEAKFHARPGIKTDLQVAMYSYARLLDLQEQSICEESVCGIKEFWVITNTKFTSTAVKYGRCVGLKMLSWSYPPRNNLHDQIQKAKIYPITVLKTLSTSQKITLVDHDIIICSDLLANRSIMKVLHLSNKKEQEVIEEVKQMCS